MSERGHAAAGRPACRRRTARAALTPPHATLARAPEPPDPADAHPAPLRRRLAPPSPGRAVSPLPLLRAAARALPAPTTPPPGGARAGPTAPLLPRRRAGRRVAPPPRAARPYAWCAAARCGVRDRAGKTPLPLTSGAHWSGGVKRDFSFILCLISAVICKVHIKSRKNVKNMK